MKRLMVLFLAAALVLAGLSALADVSPAQLVGTWYGESLTSPQGSFVPLGDYRLELNRDKTGRIIMNGLETDCAWSFSEGSAFLRVGFLNLPITLEDDRLTIEGLTDTSDPIRSQLYTCTYTREQTAQAPATGQAVPSANEESLFGDYRGAYLAQGGKVRDMSGDGLEVTLSFAEARITLGNETLLLLADYRDNAIQFDVNDEARSQAAFLLAGYTLISVTPTDSGFLAAAAKNDRGETGFVVYLRAVSEQTAEEPAAAEETEDRSDPPDAAFYEYTTRGEEAIILKYTGTDAEVNVPKYLGGMPVTAIWEKAFYQNSTLAKVTFPDTLTFIGEEAFSYCSRLEEVCIPGSVRSLDKKAFDHCKLSALTLCDGLETIGESCFYFSKLEEVALPDSLKYIGKDAFIGCPLRHITIPAGVETIDGNPFTYITGLQLTVDSGNSRFMTDSQGLLIDRDTGTVLSAAGTPKNVDTVVIPEGIRRIGAFAFYYCCNCRHISFPSRGLESIGIWGFSGCEYLEEITVPDGTVIEDNAFSGCFSLHTAVIGRGTGKLYNTFFQCFKLDSLTLPDTVTELSSGFIGHTPLLETLVIPSGVTAIDDSAFDNTSEKLTLVVTPGSFAEKYARDRGMKYVYSLQEAQSGNESAPVVPDDLPYLRQICGDAYSSPMLTRESMPEIALTNQYIWSDLSSGVIKEYTYAVFSYSPTSLISGIESREARLQDSDNRIQTSYFVTTRRDVAHWVKDYTALDTADGTERFVSAKEKTAVFFYPLDEMAKDQILCVRIVFNLLNDLDETRRQNTLADLMDREIARIRDTLRLVNAGPLYSCETVAGLKMAGRNGRPILIRFDFAPIALNYAPDRTRFAGLTMTDLNTETLTGYYVFAEEMSVKVQAEISREDIVDVKRRSEDSSRAFSITLDSGHTYGAYVEYNDAGGIDNFYLTRVIGHINGASGNDPVYLKLFLSTSYVSWADMDSLKEFVGQLDSRIEVLDPGADPYVPGIGG